MTKPKRYIAALLSIMLLLSAAACKNTAKDSTPTTQAPSQSQTAPDASQPEAAQPQAATGEEAALLFNEAVRLLNEAGSYTMTGSVNSSSVMGDVASNVVTTIDCTYEKDDQGKEKMLMNASQQFNGSVFDHSTYFSDGKYYIHAIDSNYFVETNDFGDYHAAQYAMPVEDTVLTDVEIRPAQDENYQRVSFQIPYGVYASEALAGILGYMVDDTVLQQPLTVWAGIDEDGMLRTIYLYVETVTVFGDENVEQSVIVSLSIDNYSTAAVTAPADLDSYEDRTDDGEFGQQDGTDHEEIDPNDYPEGIMD